jgi:transglutaminase-like putative cysteine protease
MGIHIGIEHRTTYRFDRSVQIHPHVLRLRPAPHCRTPILAYSLRVTPRDNFINWQQDPFGNFMARLVFPEPATLLDITVDLIADLTVINPFDFFVEESAKAFPFDYEPQLAADLEPYLRPAAPLGPNLQAWLSGVQRPEASTPIFSSG